MSALPSVPLNEPIQKITVSPTNANIVQSVNNIMGEFGFPSLPEWWNYVWTVDHDPAHSITGTFPKRLKKWLFLEHATKPSDKIMADLGERIKRYLPIEMDWWVDFTNVFDWRPGTFGDTASCWWDDRDAARILLADNDGFAMRRWGVNKEPYARCWVAAREDHYMLFNCYKATSYPDTSLPAMAIFMAGMLGLYDKHEVAITNLRRNNGLIYANGGEGSVVGPKDVIKDMQTTDMNIDVSEYSPMCNYCGTDLYGISKHPVGKYLQCDACYRNQSTKVLLPYAQAAA